MSASAAAIANAGDYVFRTWASDANAAKTLHSYISKKHTTLGILSEQTDYSQGFLDSFSKSNQNSTLKIVSESFLTDTASFRSILLKLKARNIEGLFINSQTESTFLSALKQVKELGINIPIYSAYWAGSRTFLDQAKDMANGIVFVDLPSVGEIVSPEGMKLFQEFEERYGKMNSVDLMFFSAFEGFRALHQAIESGQDVRKFLYTTTFHGMFGDWKFDQNGEIQGLNFVIKEVRDRVPVTIR